MNVCVLTVPTVPVPVFAPTVKLLVVGVPAAPKVVSTPWIAALREVNACVKELVKVCVLMIPTVGVDVVPVVDVAPAVLSAVLTACVVVRAAVVAEFNAFDTVLVTAVVAARTLLASAVTGCENKEALFANRFVKVAN